MSDFWSRRKRAVEAERAAEERARAEAEAAEARTALEDLPEAEQLERLGLPDPDTLGPGDDVAAFMAEAVPAALRSRALRRLWRSNPVLANLDGLAEYAEDYTGTGRPGGILRTTYEVGRGLAKHAERMAQEAEATAETEGAPEDPEADSRQEQSGKNVVLSGGCGEARVAEAPAGVETSARMPPDAEAGGRGSPSRKRMTFSFGEDDDDERDEPGRSGRTA